MLARTFVSIIGVGSKSILGGGGTNIHCDRGDLRCVLSLEDKDWLNENCVTNWSFFIASIYVYRLTVTIIITESIGLAISCRVLKPTYKRGFGEERSRTFLVSQYQARGESGLPGILPKLPLMPDNNEGVVAGKLYKWVRS